ncbi:unnamed protein product [Cylindrotheca closterium]|uniref:N-alpha-acetyltransferase 60 n=1 Tax=Cylindrotheca closterium TaxID=2856 RepID=A0AAD2FKL9_9STRA|nr:unnamed protein product [Cylindrotheca closterium]
MTNHTDETNKSTASDPWAELTRPRTKDDVLSTLLSEYDDDDLDIEAGTGKNGESSSNRNNNSSTPFAQKSDDEYPADCDYDYDDDDENDEETSPYFYRRILPRDRQAIQALHEEWFPVSYQEEFYDHLVMEEMCHSNAPLYTNLLCQPNTASQHDDEDEILACLVGISLEWNKLNSQTRQNLLPDTPYYKGKHKRVFYIMTLGTVDKVRNQGLATTMIEECMQQVVENDPACGALYLHVITSNASAIRFYERLHFWRVQEIEDYYTIDGEKYNCYLYARYFHGNRGHLGPVKAFTGWISSILKKAFRPPRKNNWNRKIARKGMTQNNGNRFKRIDVDANEFD